MGPIFFKDTSNYIMMERQLIPCVFCKKLNQSRSRSIQQPAAAATAGEEVKNIDSMLLSNYPLVVHFRTMIDHVQIDLREIESHSPLIQQKQRH